MHSHDHTHHHGHHHHHHHHHGSLNDADDTAFKRIRFALVLNFTFAIVELVGGYLTGSVAIISDALHDFGDSLALGFALVMQKLSMKKSDHLYSYGYRRMSLLSALFASGFLLFGSIYVIVNAALRLPNPQLPHVPGMIGLAILGIVVNGISAWRVKRGQTLNEQAISWHLVEDLLGWVVILVGAVAINVLQMPVLDPILAIGFALFILRGVYKTFRSSARLFLQGAPESVSMGNITKAIEALPGVESSHDLHVWSLDGESHVLTIHVVVKEDCSPLQIEEVKKLARHQAGTFGIQHATIEIEFSSTDCPTVDCVQK